MNAGCELFVCLRSGCTSEARPPRLAFCMEKTALLSRLLIFRGTLSQRLRKKQGIVERGSKNQFADHSVFIQGGAD